MSARGWIVLGVLALIVANVLLFIVTVHDSGAESAIYGWLTFYGMACFVGGVVAFMAASEKKGKG